MRKKMVVAALWDRPGRSALDVGRRLVAAGLVFSLISTQVGPAFAQTDQERAGARAAATEGAQAFRDHNWSQALDLFNRAESLVHAPTHLLYIARAEANLGQLVKAQETYNKIVREKLDASAPSVFREAQNDANKELRELEPRIPMAKITVQGGEGKKLDLKMDGNPLASALIGVPIPIDPGQHMFVATAPADRLASDPVTVTIKEAAKETVVLTLKPSNEPMPVAGAPGGATPAPGGMAAAQPPTQPAGAMAPAAATAPADGSMVSMGGAVSADTAGHSANGMRIGAYAALGVGAVGLGLGTIFGLSAKSKENDAESKFDQFNCASASGCPDHQNEIVSLQDDSSSARTLATVGFIVGGVGVASGVVLLLLSAKKGGTSSAATAPDKPSRAPTATIYPYIGPGTGGVFGTF